MLLLGEENRIQIVLITVPKSLLFRLADTYRATQNACCVHHPRHFSPDPGLLPNLGFWRADSAGTRQQLLVLLRKSVIA